MKTWIILAGLSLTIFVGCSAKNTQPNVSEQLEGTSASERNQQVIIPDLGAVPEGNGWKGAIDTAKVGEKDGAAAIEINDENFNVIWIDGFEFTNGTIEFDAKGKSEPTQGSFVGIAFQVVDDIRPLKKCRLLWEIGEKSNIEPKNKAFPSGA